MGMEFVSWNVSDVPRWFGFDGCPVRPHGFSSMDVREFSRLPDVPMSRRRFPGGCLYVSGLIDVQIVHSDVLTDVQSFSRLPNVPDVQVMFCRWMSQASPDWWMSKASALISVTDVPTVSSLTNVPAVHFCFSCRISRPKDVSRFRRFRC
jgi:hypothetical protein